MIISEREFAVHSVITAADLLELPPVRGKLIVSQFLIRIVGNIY